jgi:LPXTG-motif cell wall-anchored protein
VFTPFVPTVVLSPPTSVVAPTTTAPDDLSITAVTVLGEVVTPSSSVPAAGTATAVESATADHVSGSSQLPFTGSNSSSLVITGLFLIATGSALLITRRMRWARSGRS